MSQNGKSWPWYLQLITLFTVVSAPCYWLSGCAASRLTREATLQDRAACEKDAGSYTGAAWMIAYRDCLKAKGYK